MTKQTLEDISSRNYKLSLIEKTKGSGDYTLMIQDRNITSDYIYCNENGLEIYRQLKRLARTGKTFLFERERRERIREKMSPKIEVSVPIKSTLSIKLYAGDVLVKASEDEELWINTIKDMIARTGVKA